LQQLWSGEEFFLSLDSHMRFVIGWDEFLISTLARCPSPRPILTTYPSGYERPNAIDTDPRPVFTVASSFGSPDGMLRLAGKRLTKRPDAPLPTAFWVAGFSFSRSEVIREVPYDPHLPFLFFGEETLMSARLWTAGWDFFAPPQHVVYHLWSRAYRSTFREIPGQDELRAEAMKRLRVLLRLESSPHLLLDVEQYSLGTARSLKEWEQHAGVDLSARQLTDRARFGGLPQQMFVQSAAEAVLSLLSSGSPLP
jgi:[Skp1-protein]-hydroxyproline N-acetylglucosaminyltransferase